MKFCFALVRRVRITMPAARPRAWTPKRMASRCVGGVFMAVLCGGDPWGSCVSLNEKGWKIMKMCSHVQYVKVAILRYSEQISHTRGGGNVYIRVLFCDVLDAVHVNRMCLPNQSERVSNWFLSVALYNQNAILIHGIVAGLLWLDNLSIFVLCFPWTAVLIIIALRAELKAFLTDLLDLSVNSLANFLYEPQECSLVWAGTFSRQRKGLISSRSRFGGSGVGVSLDSELQCKDLKKGWHKLGTNFCKLERFGDNTCTRFRMAQHGSFAICHQGSAFSSLCSFSFLPETKSCTSGRVQLQRLCHFIDQNQEIISRQHNV